MKICILSSQHPPNDDRIYYKEARSLAKEHEVTLIVPFRNHTVPAGDNLEIIYTTHHPRVYERPLAISTLVDIGLSVGADVYHCHEPDSLVAAVAIKRRRSCAVVFDSHELWSGVAAARFPRPLWGLGKWTYRLLERPLVARCDRVIGASWPITEYLGSIVGRDKAETILNCPVPEVMGPLVERRYDGELTICHDGFLPFSRGLETMAGAIAKVAERHPIRFKIVGDVFGKERAWLEAFVASSGLQEVITRTGWLEYEDVGAAMAPCHIGLSALQRLPNSEISAANKDFNYLYFGMPFISPDYRYTTQKLYREEGCVIPADSSSADSYAQAIISLVEDRALLRAMSERALGASRAKYQWPHQEPRLLALYREL